MAGCTGLIGRHLLELLIHDARYSKIKCLTRSTLHVTNEKIEIIKTDGSNLNDLASSLKADDVFCCLGTTMKKARSEEAFRKIDFEYPLHLANLSKAMCASQFFLVSSLGANSSSSVFYNKVKGEVEEAVSAVGYHSLHVFRPSLLLGPRSEERSGEDAAKVFFRLFGFLVPGKYKAIQSIKVASAMLMMAKEDKPGKFIHESKSLQQY